MGKKRKLFDLAQSLLVGGVDSPVRSFNYVAGEPLFVKSGRGATVFDYNNKAYIDYVLSWGVAMLGHAHPFVIDNIKQTLESGLSFGTTNKLEVDLAGAISRAIPFIEKIRFVNSGTEAAMGAIRLARGYSGRDKIIKFENAYHGHADYLLAKAGSGLSTLGISVSRGVPQDYIKHTIIARLGDKEGLKNIFNKYLNNIAAVIIEPAGGNYGVLPPDIDFLKEARVLTKKYKALLIFDEVITGFRFDYGTAAQSLGVTPDLITLGKIIGGGLPVGAYGGKKEIMDNLAPLGKVYQSSTFAGNPVVMRAGLATLKILKKEKHEYCRIKELTAYLCTGLKDLAQRYSVPLEIVFYENMFSLKFKDKKRFAQFYKLMLGNGVFFAPSEFEANFLSFAHKNKHVEETLKKIEMVFKKIGG